MESERRMKMKTVSGIMLTLLFTGMLTLAFNIQTVSAGEYPAIYIDPPITEDPTLTPGKNYIISIKTDYNGSDVWGWSFSLTYDPRILHGGVKKTDTWTSFPNNTDTWTGDNRTRIFYTTRKPVVPDSEEVYVNKIFMTKPANYTIDYPEGKLTFTTAPGLDANVTAIYQHLTFSTAGTPVVPDSEEVYVNQTLMTRIARITDKWIGDGETRTFYTTQPVFPGTETVLVNRMPPSWWGLDYTVDYSTGKITFDPAPWMGAEIKVAYDNWGNYTIDYSTGTITFEIGSQPPEGVETKATYLYGGVTNGDLITKDKDPTAWFKPGTFNNTIGKLSTTNAFFMYLGTPQPVASGPGTLANVTFTVVDKGISNITLGPETALLNNEGGTIIDHTQHGYFSNAPAYTLTIYSSPTGVTFIVDGVSRTTPWSGTYSENTSVSLIMPEIHTVGDARYYWNQWSDGNTSRSRTVTMTANITLTAYYTGPYYELTVTSSPMTGITFTIDGLSRTTPYTEWLLEGSYTLIMPQTHNGYVWSHWLEDGDTNRIKTITLPGTTWTAVYEPAPEPVGGKATPINMPIIKPELPTPWIWLSTIILSMVATGIYLKKRKRNREINS